MWWSHTDLWAGSLDGAQWAALVDSSFWKEPHACNMEKVSVLSMSNMFFIFSLYMRCRCLHGSVLFSELCRVIVLRVR